MRKLVFLLCMLMASAAVNFNANAQGRKFDDILSIRLRSSGTIVENNEVRGYFMFYNVDKGAKGKNIYLLRILDENLEDFKTTTIEESKYVTLLESVYNGEAIMLKFIDFKGKRLIFMSYDKNAELISKTEREADRMELAYYNNVISTNQEANFLADITGKGFADYAMINSGKGYAINFISSEKSGKNWNKVSTNTKTYESAAYLCNSEDLIFNLVAKRPGRMSTKVEFAVNAYDIETGVKAFETDFKSEKYSAQPLNAYYNKETGLVNIIGIYYEPDVKTMKDNGLGLFNYRIDRQGNMVSEKYLSWAQDFRKFVTVDNDGRVSNDKKNGFIFFHDIIQNPDGSIIAVGEQYKKAADAAGIAMRAMGGAASTVKMVINDMIIFHFNKDFGINTVEFVEKTKSDFTLPYGAGFNNIHMLSNLVKAYGGFDYSFTSKSMEKGTASIGYVDCERKQGAKNEFVFGAVTYYNGKFSSDKIPLGRPKGRDWVRVMPGKPGYVVLFAYDRKEKSLEVRQEKINY